MGEISIQGTRRGIVLSLPEALSIEALNDALDAKLTASQSLLVGSRVTLDLGGRALDAEALGAIKSRLSERFSVEVVRARATEAGTQAAAEEAGLSLEAAPPAQPGEADAELPELASLLPDNAHYMRQTIRSGQSIRHFGSIVICGDVNPGAEVIATGDIIVFGTLRGVAHAGATGDDGAQIVAINLRPTQIRIAGFIARSPDSAAPPLSKYPEVARIQDGEIHILPLRDTI